jgi:hypothetical protein
MWNNCATDVARQNLEQQVITRSPVAEVQVAAMVKINLRPQATVGTLTGQVGAALAAAAAANQAAVDAQAVATAAGNADCFRPAAPPKYGNKKKDADVKQWILIIEDYLRAAPDADYIRLASSYLEGGPRSLWTSVYEAWKAANGGAEPPTPWQFFRETLENNYGLQDLEHKHWDTWNAESLPGYWRVQYRVKGGLDGPGWLCYGRASEDREISLGSSARFARVVQNVSNGCPVG